MPSTFQLNFLLALSYLSMYMYISIPAHETRFRSNAKHKFVLPGCLSIKQATIHNHTIRLCSPHPYCCDTIACRATIT